MKVIASGQTIDLGKTETAPTIGITDFSHRVTDDFGVTTVVERDFARRMSVRFALPTTSVDAVQRRLADLRATAALWVADERFAWLSVNGFFKDFELDLSVPPLSYCTLTVEGLAETISVTDTGGDPAPDGQASTLQLLQPVAMTDATLIGASVPENEAPYWSPSATYAAGARVTRAGTHRLCESLVAGNVGNDPASSSGKWLDLGPTNRWAMFDEALGTATSATDSIDVVLSAGTINAVALLDVVGVTARVQAPGYDRTITVTGGVIPFLDLPTTTGNVTVSIGGSGTVSVGTLLIGRRVALGITEASPTAGITDFSRKEVDDFGGVAIVQRAWAKRMQARALIRTDALDVVANRIAAVRARPSLWIGQTGLDSLTVYGFFKDFSIEVGESVSKLSLSIEGLSTAAKVEPLGSGPVNWTDVIDNDPARPKPANGADKTSQNTAKDVANIGGEPTATVKERIAQAVQDIDAVEQKADGLLLTYGQTAAAAASREAADGAKAKALEYRDGAKTFSETASTEAGRAEGFAQQADDAKAAAATYSLLTASTGPGVLNRNPNFAAWPDGQELPTGWTAWDRGDNPTAFQRVAGRNGNPYALRMVAGANKNVGVYQTIQKGFGSYVVEVEIVADNVSGAGLFVQLLKADGSEFSNPNSSQPLSLLNKIDSSRWAGVPDGSSGNYVRNLSWYVPTPINGDIVSIQFYVMANWDNFTNNLPVDAGRAAAQRVGKTIDWHKVRIRDAYEAEIAQHDPINGLGSKASITYADSVGTDAAGYAIAESKKDFDAQFYNVGLSLGQRPTFTAMTATVGEAITAAVGPDSALALKVSNAEVGVGGNLVPNDVLATYDGWGFDPRGTSAQRLDINGPSDDWHPPLENAMCIYQAGGDPGNFSHLYSQLMAVEPGKFYQVSVLANSHRCNVEMYIHHYATTSAGDGGPPSISGQVDAYNADGKVISGYRTIVFNFVARTNFVLLALMKWGTKQDSDSYAWFLRPQLVKVPAGNTPQVPFRSGNSTAAARITQASLKDALGKLAAYLKLQAIAGTSSSELVLMAQDGQPSTVYIRGSQIILDGEVIFDNSVRYSKIPNGDLSRKHFVNWGDVLGIPEGDNSGTGGFTVPVAGVGPSGVDITVQFEATRSGTRSFDASAVLFRDGVELPGARVTASTSGYGVPISFFRIDNPGPGNHTYSIVFYVDNSGFGQGGSWSFRNIQAKFEEFNR